MLLGRAVELERVGRLAGGAREGHGDAIVIVGEPGIGKTSLLAAAIAAAGVGRTIRTAGIEAEANLPYAALGEVMAPLLDGLSRLPEPQIEAIEAALALRSPPPAPRDRFATCAAFLNLLTGSAEGEALLVVVDDAHWLDRSSAECLAYAARRLAGSRVALLVAARPSIAGPLLGSSALTRLELSGLSDADARRMVRAAAPDATAAVVESLVELSGGQPARAARAAGRAERGPAARAGADRSPPGRCRSAPGGIRGPAEAFDPDARAAVVVAAAATDRELGPVVASVFRPRDRKRRHGACRGGWNGGDQRGPDPLFPPARQNRRLRPAPRTERRHAHRALAGALRRRPSRLAPRRVDPRPRRRRRGAARRHRATRRRTVAPSVAADALQRAAGFSEDAAGRSRRLYGAALSAALAGTYHRCAALLEANAESEIIRCCVLAAGTASCSSRSPGASATIAPPPGGSGPGRSESRVPIPPWPPRCTPTPPCWPGPPASSSSRRRRPSGPSRCFRKPPRQRSDARCG